MADNSQNLNIFRTILYHSIFIILAPISTFFIVKVCIFEGVFGVSTVASNVWSAIAAVVVLHVALAIYIYRAYSESGKIKLDKDDKLD